MTAPNQPSGIVPRTYKSGSIIYFEGDKSEYIYILKSGRVMLTYTKLETAEEIKEPVKQGEFFGVKSSLGRYPREETAQTIGDTVILVMPIVDFEKMVLKNFNVVRKMLRVFSNQLRRLVRAERAVLGEEETKYPDQELFKIGEYYRQSGEHGKAIYAYKKYMEHYPDGEYASQAMQRIKGDSGTAAVESGGDDYDFDVPPDTPDTGMDDGMSDFSLDDDEPLSAENPFDDDLGLERSPLSDEMDDFLSDDSMDDFSFDLPEESDESVTDLFEEGERYFEQEDYPKALELFEKVITAERSGEHHVRDYNERSHLRIGQCQIEMGQLKNALETLNTLARDFPESPLVKEALFHIGLVFRKAGKGDKALPYFNKVLNMPPGDDLNEKAMKHIQMIQKGG